MKLDQDKLDYLTALFSIAKSLAEHGAFPRIQAQVMAEIKEFDKEGSLQLVGERIKDGV